MSCTDPEFAEWMRRSPAEKIFGDHVPFTAEELEAATAPVLALSRLADAVAVATHAERVDAPVGRRDELDRVLALARAEAETLNPSGVSGVWVGLGMPARYGRPRAAVCLDCGWVGRVTSAPSALLEALAHDC